MEKERLFTRIMSTPFPSSHPAFLHQYSLPPKRLITRDPGALLLLRVLCHHPQTKCSTQGRKQHLGFTNGKMRQSQEGAHMRTQWDLCKNCNLTSRASSFLISRPLITAFPPPQSFDIWGGKVIRMSAQEKGGRQGVFHSQSVIQSQFVVRLAIWRPSTIAPVHYNKDKKINVPDFLV